MSKDGLTHVRLFALGKYFVVEILTSAIEALNGFNAIFDGLGQRAVIKRPTTGIMDLLWKNTRK